MSPVKYILKLIISIFLFFLVIFKNRIVASVWFDSSFLKGET